MTDGRAHSRYGGSVIGRVIACPGSPALCDTVPKSGDSAYAAEGTHAHAVGEYCLKNGLRSAGDLVHMSLPLGEDLPATISGKVVTKEMADAVDVYLDAVWEEVDASPDAELYVEQTFELDIAAAPGEVYGSNDALVYSPSKARLVVFDYKHGVGVSVTADDNAQLKFYAAGAALSHPDWRIREVVLVIVQPRSRDADTVGAVRPWSMEPLDLIEFTGTVEKAVAATQEAGHNLHWSGVTSGAEEKFAASLKAGSHCRWCDAAPVCPAKERQILDAIPGQFKGVNLVTPSALPEVKTLDTKRLGEVLVALQHLSAWQKQVEEYVEGLLMSGTPVEGWKVVEKIGRRKWIENDEEVVAYLELHGVARENAYPPKLCTITEAERLLKAECDKVTFAQAKETLALKYTLKESSGNTIAPATDRREAVDAIKQAFGSVRL